MTDQSEVNNKWAVLIYMAATSPRLRAVMEQDLREMRSRLRFLSPSDIRVCAQMDTPDGTYVTRQWLSRIDSKSSVPNPPDPPIVVHLEPAVGAKQFFLQNFVYWRFTEAKHQFAGFDRTLLILWGHSQGVAAALSQPGSPAYAMVGNGGFGIDELSGDSLSLKQIRVAIANGLPAEKHIDILSFDSCFMSAAEVAGEFQSRAPADAKDKDVARIDYVVASQSAILLDGLDYGRVADAFVACKVAGVIEPVALGRRLLQQAGCGDQSPTTLSLIRTGSAPIYQAFQEAVRKLVDELARILDTGTDVPLDTSPPQRLRRTPPGAGPNRSEWLRIRDAFEGATWHRVRQFVDLADLCRRLANNSRDERLRSAALCVLDKLRLDDDGTQRLIVDVRSTHPLVLSGFSIYCPWLFPTPDEVRHGAWNAVVDLFDYAKELWFNSGKGSWGAFLFHAKHLLEESRQRALNTEVSDMRAAIAAAAHGIVLPLPIGDGAKYRLSKPPDDMFHAAEPPRAGDNGAEVEDPTGKPYLKSKNGDAVLASKYAPGSGVSIALEDR